MLVRMLLWNSLLSFLHLTSSAYRNKSLLSGKSLGKRVKFAKHYSLIQTNVTTKVNWNLTKTKRVAAFDTRTNSSRNQSDIQTQIQELRKELGKLKSKISGKSSMYCDFLPTNICGSCSCVNDVRLPKKYYCDCRHVDPQQDCLEFYQNGYKTNGVYKITGSGYRPVEAFCDQTTDNGGWTVFQRRLDGTESFHRDWEMYKVGFGDIQFEHWLGNEHIHKLLLHSLYYQGTELRIDLVDWDSKRKHAKYDQFQVDSEFAKYELHVGGYSGSAGDALGQHNKLSFTTIDQDNDLASTNCAQKYAGGWWYAATSCTAGATLNHRYYQLGTAVPSWFGIVWTGMNSAAQSLKRTEMKFRRKV